MPNKNNKNDSDLKSNLNLHFDFSHILAALSYVWILCLIPLLLKPKDEYVRFHAKQGLILFAAEILGTLIFWLPVIGQIIFIAFLIVSLIGIYKALKGDKWEIPVLHKYSKRI